MPYYLTPINQPMYAEQWKRDGYLCNYKEPNREPSWICTFDSKSGVDN